MPGSTLRLLRRWCIRVAQPILRLPVWILLLGVLGLHVSFGWTAAEDADIRNYGFVADILLRGGQLYRDTPGLYPYPPLWAGIEVAARVGAAQMGLPFAFLMTLPGTVADVAIVGVLAAWAGRPAAVLYGVLPLPLLVASFHGQFDAVPILFTLLACASLARGHACLAALHLAVGIALKGFPVLVLPLALMRISSWRGRIIFAAVALLPTVVLLLPFLLAAPADVVGQLFEYSGALDHGPAMLLRSIVPHLPIKLGPNWTTWFLLGTKVVFLAVYSSLLLRRYYNCEPRTLHNLVADAAAVIAAFYVCYGGISSQYLLWLLPFLLIIQWRAGVVYAFLATLALVGFYTVNYPQVVHDWSLIIPEDLRATVARITTLIWWSWSVWWFAKYAVGVTHVVSHKWRRIYGRSLPRFASANRLDQ
jgi:hypothetical protein